LPVTLSRSLFAAFLGTALLVFVTVGSAVAGLEVMGPRASPWPSGWCCPP
jgi:aquaporin Z